MDQGRKFKFELTNGINKCSSGKGLKNQDLPSENTTLTVCYLNCDGLTFLKLNHTEQCFKESDRDMNEMIEVEPGA